MNKGTCISCLVLSLAAMAFVNTSCKKKSPEAIAAEVTAPADDKTAVCMYDGMGVRDAIGKNAKYISSLALGESVKWTGATDKDESGREYLKVELSDGKSGWVSASGIATGAQIGAIKEDSVTYKRPDLVTATNQKLPLMTIVAVISQKDAWYQVVGESKKALGWVRKDSVTLEKEDVTVAILATKKLREKDGLDQVKKIEAIVQTTPNPNSFFIQKLKEQAAASAATSPAGGETPVLPDSSQP
jgi:acid phosphatase family membrane protein YuiD